MLTVGSRGDGRKSLGLGFGVGMEENELEEGEACSGHEGEALTSEKDLVNLSYIDEKLEDVLGHFQKDFEGGVSAENLGAMFGGYGSFLPMYQRSPSIWCQPRSPPNASSHNGSRSPENTLCEGAHQNHLVSTCASINKPSATSVALSFDKSCKTDLSRGAINAGETVTQHDLYNKLVNGSDQKTLKVRIKVGQESVSARDNAAIYSGLGLDISPSSSLEDSPCGSEGLSTELRVAPDESPMTIIQIMTCFPVPGGYLLSPLPDTLLYLSKKKSFLNNLKSGKLNMSIPENCSVLAELTTSSRNVKVLEKKTKILEKNGKAMDVKNSSCKDDISSILKREIDIETQDGQEIVSDALNIPIFSDPTGVEEKEDRLFVGESTKGTTMFDLPSEPNKLLAKGRVYSSELVKDGQRELMENIGNVGVGVSVDEITHLKGKINSKTSITEKVLEEKIVSNHKRTSSDVRNEGENKNEKCYGTKGDFDEVRWKKDFVFGSIETPKENMVPKANLYEQDAEMMFRAWDRQSEGRGQLKKSQTNGTPSVESTKRNPKTHSSSKSKENKSSSHLRKRDYLENKLKESKFENDHPGSFSKESHIDAEDMKIAESRSRLLHVKDKLTGREHDYEDPLLTLSGKTKERPVVKKVDNLPISEEVSAQQVASLTVSIPGSDAVAASNAPVLIKENWVCCDRCQKWRLLPYGANPALLPKKWHCNMLNWLQPGMNRCNISEEETTKALNALYQMPVPQSNTSLNGIPDVAAPNTILADPHHLSRTFDNNMNSAGAIGKKKHKLKDQANPANDSASLLIASSAKKNQLASLKSRSLNDVNHPLESNLSSKVAVELVCKSTDFSSDKQNFKHKEKHRIVGRHSDGGDYGECVGKHSKSKSKGEVEQEGLTTTKRFKRDGSHHTGEDKDSEHNVVRNAVLITDNGLPTSASQHNMHKYNGFSSFKEVNGDSDSNLPASSKRTKVQPHSLPNEETRELVSVLNREKKSVSDSGKKRKIKNWQESQDHLANIASSERPVDSKGGAKETFSENEMKREKIPKVSKSEVDESSTSKADVKLEKKGCTTKILLSGGVQHSIYEMEKSGFAGKESQVEQYHVNTVSRQALDGVESLKKDLTYPQTSAAATSSSSKISGSRRSKGNLQEVRGSPVESVSSSPFRTSNSEKPFPSRKKSGGKDDAGFCVIGSPKNCSDGEADEGNDLPEVRNNKDSAQRRSVEGHRSMDSRGLVSLRGTYDNEDKEAQATDGIHLKLFGDAHDDSSPTEFEETNLVNNGVNTSNHRYKCQPLDEDQIKMNNRYLANGSVQWKSGKSSSTRSRDNQSSKSSNDKGKIKVSNSFTEQVGLFSSKSEDNCQDNVHNNSSDWPNYPKDLRDEHHSYQKDREDHSLKKEPKAQVCSGGIKGVHTDHSLLGDLEVNGCCLSDKHHKDLNSRVLASGASCSKFGSRDNSQQVSYVDERNIFDRSEMLVGRGKSQSIMSLRDKQENQTYGSQAVPTPIKAVKSEGFPSDSTNGDALKAVKPRKPDEQLGAQHGSLRQATPNRPEPRSPSRRDSHSVASVLKEARDLKHTANRLKSEGLELESTGLYFQAALKFLYYAFLLEPNAENARHGDGTQSMQMYSDTARLCEFCAHEYERCKQMAAASLAYKCVEVAYMKVSYLKHSSVSKDRLELQAALQMVVPGESPSSSASDVDNLNNQGTLDKGTAGKGVSSPQVAGNHVIAARNRPSFVRLLNYANETVCAFDASKKMHIAFAAASFGSDKNGSGCLVSVRNVLDFNFHNVERLLQLIRLAMELISCL